MRRSNVAFVVTRVRARVQHARRDRSTVRTEMKARSPFRSLWAVGIPGLLLLGVAGRMQHRERDSHEQPPGSPEQQVLVLRTKVARLEAALASSHSGTAPAKADATGSAHPGGAESRSTRSIQSRGMSGMGMMNMVSSIDSASGMVVFVMKSTAR